MLTLTSGEGASAFFAEVDRNVSLENPDPGKFIGIADSHGLRFPPRQAHPSKQRRKQ